MAWPLLLQLTDYLFGDTLAAKKHTEWQHGRVVTYFGEIENDDDDSSDDDDPKGKTLFDRVWESTHRIRARRLSRRCAIALPARVCSHTSQLPALSFAQTRRKMCYSYVTAR